MFFKQNIDFCKIIFKANLKRDYSGNLGIMEIGLDNLLGIVKSNVWMYIDPSENN